MKTRRKALSPIESPFKKLSATPDAGQPEHIQRSQKYQIKSWKTVDRIYEQISQSPSQSWEANKETQEKPKWKRAPIVVVEQVKFNILEDSLKWNGISHF